MNYTKKGKQSKKLNPKVKELLIRYHLATQNIPSIQQLIETLDIPTTRQNIDASAKKRKAMYEV